MDKNEVITLSSDEESDITYKFQKSHASEVIKSELKDSSESLKSCFQKFKNININKNKGVIIRSNTLGVQVVKLAKVPEIKQIVTKETPEIVDLECSEKSTEDEQVQVLTNNKSPKHVENHSNVDIIDVDEIQNGDNSLNNVSLNKPDIINENTSKPTEVEEGCQIETKDEILNTGSHQNLKFFTEFVEYCGSLEEIPNDRARLTKKLMKRYGEADSKYIKSQGFRNFIESCRNKVNKNNLYLIAKEITDELCFRKKIEISTGKSNLVEETSQRHQGAVTETVKENSTKQSKKRTKVINKIIQKLDKLGNKIKELEEKEVDLSDEEESAYVQLQRCRERFCQIYTKLCKYTNEIADAEHCSGGKICFTESKYPAINKCIENWLNKTKRFPDFSDIMKLLESQSASLGLPSNRESIRAIAIEIFQKVGAMLQRRRKYELWDSFCGFLDGGEDPAVKDVLLDKVLKSNYEIRIKKEQEIFQYYAELQEKERLEPEEVLDEEANRSPVESGNEDDKEIEDIENSINQRLDDEIKKDTEENESALGTSELDANKNGLLKEEKSTSKESKNNYKNCKSLKWRLENGVKGKSDSVSSVDSTDTEKDVQKNGIHDNTKPAEVLETDSEIIGEAALGTSLKRKLDLEKDATTPRKRKCSNKENEEKKVDIFEAEEETQISEKKTKEVFQIHCCQIFQENFLEELSEKRKDWGKRRVFKDLTNVGRLMELQKRGKREKPFGLFTPSLFHRSYVPLEAPSWKKRFKVSFKLVATKEKKCALSQEEKSQKTANPESNGDEKNNQNNSERTGDDDEGENFPGGRGNGSEGDNNEDENKKNGRTGDELNDNQPEDDDEEEETEKEEDNKPEGESNEHSFPYQKTEEPTEGNETTAEPVSDPGRSEENAKEQSDTSVEILEGDVSFGKNEIPAEETKATAVGEKQKTEDTQTTKAEEKKETKETPTGKALESNSNPKREKETREQITENSETEHLDSREKKKCNVSELTEPKRGTNGKLNKQVISETKNNNCNNETQKSNAKSNDKMTSVKEKQNEKAEKSQEEKDRGEKGTKVEVPRKKRESQSSSKDVKIINRRLRSEDRNLQNTRQRSLSKSDNKVVFTPKENERLRARRKVRETPESKATPVRMQIPVDPPGHRMTRRNAPSTSDEERVKRFLLHSPSSISITPPRKLTLSKPPSQAAMQALATLRNLKGISATIVRGGKPKREDDVVVIGGSYKRRQEQNSGPVKQRRGSDLPVISSVQTVDSTTPKIVTVQGNVSGFDNSWPEDGNSQCNSTSIRISNVWGSLPNNFMQSGSNDEAATPGCSFRQNNPGSSNAVKKKNAKKTVEYVVLE